MIAPGIGFCAASRVVKTLVASLQRLKIVFKIVEETHPPILPLPLRQKL